MKPINLIFIPLMLVYSTTSAQLSYKLGPPTPADVKSGKLFLLKISTGDTTGNDTSYHVIRIQNVDTLIVCYKLQVIHSARSIISNITDSVVKDSIAYQQLMLDSTRNKANLRISLIESSDLEAAYPIAVIYQSPQKISIEKRVDSMVDSIVKSKPVKINGTLTLIGQYSDHKYLYQSVPQSYVRGYVNTTIDVLGLPFSAGYYYTTESNSGVNQINNFRLSFQYDQFYHHLKSKMDKKIELSKTSEIKNITNIDINSLNTELSKLEYELNAKDFQQLQVKNQRYLDLGATDTVFAKTYKYKKALAKHKDYQQKLDRLNELKNLKQKYQDYSKIADYNAQVAKVNLDNPKDFRKAAKRFGFVKPGQSIFLSIKKMDIGTFDPDYTTLVLSGVNLTGINIEMNPGNLYGAFTWGKAIANFDNPLNFSALKGGRNILSGRIGVGNKDKFLVAISILKGADDPGNLVKDTSSDYYLPKYNYVIGIDAKYKISANAEAGIEYAKSQNQQISTEQNTTEQLGKLVSIDQNKYANAWNVYSTVRFNKNTSKVKVLGRVVDPFYYSFGTPYLRRDNFRIEIKGEQVFWKRQLTATITYRRDADNIHGFKQGTSVNNSLIFGAQLRIKKLPYLLLTYSPNYQSFYNAAVKQQVYTNVKFYNAIIGYTCQKQKTILNTTLSFTKQYNNSSQQEWQSFHVNQYAFYENVNFKPISLNLTAGINYTLPVSQSDTGKVLGASVSGTKGLFKNKLDVTLGSRYQKDETIEERYIIEAGTRFSLPFGISCQIQIEKHFIHPYRNTEQAEDMNLGRITLIKTF